MVKGIGRKYSAKGVRSSELLIMHRQVVQEIINEHPNVWEEIKEVALERERVNERAIVEIQEIINLRNSGELESINVKEFKRKVEELYDKRCKKLKEKHQVFTLKDLNSRIEVLRRILRNGEKPEVKKESFELIEEDID